MDAKQFKALVEVYGHQWPPADVLIAKGFAYLVPGAVVAPVALAVEEPSPVVTFEAFALEYLDRLVKPNPETKRKYLERLRVHVFPVLGERPVVEITRREMRLWQEGLLAKNLSPKTIANIRGETVSPIFEAACLPGEDDEPPLRTYNPLKGLKLPERNRPEREIVEDQQEAALVIEAAYDVDPSAADVLLMLLATGMRWGEAAGLPVRAVNFDRGTVSIMQVLRKENFQWKVIARPKTKDGYRGIPVPAQGMNIRAIRCEGRGRGRDAFVFTAPRGGHWRYEVFYDDRWKKIRELAEAKGLRKRMTMYGLRHSLLTWLASEGVDPMTLRTIAGHKRVSTTFDIYVHSTRRHHPKVKEAVSGLVGLEVGPFASRPAGDEPYRPGL
ncbi:tyrosine-type recombinase/integrase [Actinoplanes sp. N902-109]|uniref:tyrosine-type recombinase/integrase n=1 Tax=Actinoplanes sp. (strain N902-109) TaxID=649831 RepID=UPI000329454A|nr:tyrosine-type recombinase/integrase [Actinoplanes sp. N902-109]AGL16096.1 integrase [Actinoplanes sp. N902-109]